jgi:cytosine/adenosine deaminase-related metal-dependent hydrolase
MRFITADYIFPVSSSPLKNGMVVVDSDGTILDVHSQQTTVDSINIPSDKIEIYRGIICPGFINTHCHLELSHLKNKLTVGKGLPHFIREISGSRNSSPEEINDAITLAEDEMIAGGIVAVGDISNFNHTFVQKKKGRLHYHTFIELFDLIPERAEAEFQKGLGLVKEFNKLNSAPDRNSGKRNSISITPHAPYTATPKLLKLIADFSGTHDSLLTIHNEETESENEMFLDRKGKLFEILSSFGDAYKNWEATGSLSIMTSLGYLPKCNKVQLVHNTFASGDDITWAHLYSMLLWWCTCPNANLFIENKLPDYRLFMNADCRMTVGTDSYASNWSLSILDELKTIHKNTPYIPLETIIRWATLNGAEFLGFDKELGSIEKGKKPGLNLIRNIDLEKLILTEDCEVKKIV